MNKTRFQLVGAGVGTTLGIVEAETPKGAVQKWRKKMGHEDTYYDDIYHIREVMQGFRVIIGRRQK